MSIKEYKFPKGFLWGSGTAAEQIEPANENDFSGGRKPTVWNEWFKKYPNRFYEFNFSQNNFYKNYKEDIKHARDLGFNSLRISISWSRFMNEDGKTINKEAVKFYRNVLKEINSNGLKTFVCLFHFDTPMFIYKKGGWLSKETIDLFERYAKAAYEKFDDLVDYWFTYNEPNVVIGGSYLGGYMYPNKLNINQAMIAQWNMIIAHKKAVKTLKENGYKTPIGLIHSMTPAIPRSDNEFDLKAARFADMFETHSWFGPAIKGEFPKELKEDLIKKGYWPKNITKNEEELIKKYPIDIVGMNYYTPKRVKAVSFIPNWNSTATPHTHWFEHHSIMNCRMNKSRGWEIFPKSIYNIFKMVKEEYNNLPCFIGENGIGIEEQDVKRVNGIIQDQYREDFHKEHIYWVHKALKDGVNVIGYHMWTYIDNWSWANAYKNRYGFVELDLKTGQRKRKKSADFMTDLAKTNILKTNPKNY